jgi:sec-independent protein translocase protein TatA
VTYFFRRLINQFTEEDMFGYGGFPVIIILLIILVIFGAGKLPEIGTALGKGIKNFKRSFEGKDELEVKAKKEDDSNKDS